MKYETTWIKKYLLYGTIAVGLYLGGKYIASRMPAEEQKIELQSQKEELSRLQSIVRKERSEYKTIQRNTKQLLKEKSKLEKKLERYD